MPVIPSMQEAEIGRIQFLSTQSKNFLRINLNRKMLGMVACAYHSSYMESIK
jgi:hypothetical protein